MIEYKTYRFVDGKARWIIVDETGKIINRNPSKEELKGLEEEKPKGNGNYNKTNTCEICKEEKLIPGKAIKEYNKEGNWTGNWICNKCYQTKRTYGTYEKPIRRTNVCDRCGTDFDKTYGNPRKEYDEKGNWTERWDCQKCWREFDPNSDSNIIKSLRGHRTGYLDLNSSHAIGDLFQELTCIWRSTVSTIPVEDLNKKLNNYNSPIDHSWDSELGIIQTKGRLYSSKYKLWSFGNLDREWYKIFDHEICYCASEDGKIIDRIYIIPKKEIKDKRIVIGIYKNPSRGVQWYEKYRVTNEDTIKKVNDIWKEIMEK